MLVGWCKAKRCVIADGKASEYCLAKRHCQNLVLMARKNRHRDRWNKGKLGLAERRITDDPHLYPMPELQEKFQNGINGSVRRTQKPRY